MRQVLMVAEKPNLAQALSGFLSNDRALRGCIDKRMTRGLPLFEWDAPWPETGELVRYKMTSTYGHINEIAFDEMHQDWRQDPESLFTCPVEKNEGNPQAQVGRQLSSAGRGVDILVLWLDCDKEGENICFEVMNYVLPVMRTQRVHRARFSALTQHDVQGALQHLSLPNRNVSLSVDARMELDLRIGCAFTRFQTTFFKRKYGVDALKTNTVPFGPCQTPTLGFIVERHMQIESFRPEPFWRINVDVEIPGISGGVTLSKLEWKRKRTFDRGEAEMVLQNIQRFRRITVANVAMEEKRKLRPAALNTVQLLRLASSQLRMSPGQTMELAERLYTEGFISYPRTETTRYPNSFDRMAALSVIVGSDELGQYAEKLICEVPDSRQIGQDRLDHPPIIPLKRATPNLTRSTTGSHELFQLICANFLAGLAADCIYVEKTVTFDVEGERFQLDGIEVMDRGFTDILQYQRMYAREVPPLAVGTSVAVRMCALKEESTKPPDYLSESDLIDLMEKHGIGTDASISVHIASVFKRNFADLNQNRKIVPTPMGIALIGAYNALDDDLAKPQIRSTLERDLVLIAEGKAKKEDIVHHVLGIYKEKFKYLTANISVMDEAIATSLHLLPREPPRNGNMSWRRQDDAPTRRSSPPPSRSAPAHSDRKRTSRDDEDGRAVKRSRHEASSSDRSRHGEPSVYSRSDQGNQLSAVDKLPPLTARLLALSAEQSNCSISSEKRRLVGRNDSGARYEPRSAVAQNSNRIVLTPGVEPRAFRQHSPEFPVPQRAVIPANSIRVPINCEDHYTTSTAVSSQELCNADRSFNTRTAPKPSLIVQPVPTDLPQSSLKIESAFPIQQQSLKAEPQWPDMAMPPAPGASFNKPLPPRPIVKVDGLIQCPSIDAPQSSKLIACPTLPGSVSSASGGSASSSMPNLRVNLRVTCPFLKSYTIEGKDPVQAVHEICQKSQMGSPVFNIVNECGPSHAPQFTMEVLIGGLYRHGPFTAKSKKEATKGVARLFLSASGWTI